MPLLKRQKTSSETSNDRAPPLGRYMHEDSSDTSDTSDDKNPDYERDARLAKGPPGSEDPSSESSDPSSDESSDDDPDNQLIGLTPHRECVGGLSPERAKDFDPAPHDYICFHRPWFDVWTESIWKARKGTAENTSRSETWTKVYMPGLFADTRKDVFGAEPGEHKGHKWVIMWDAWKRFDGLCVKAKYCDPDKFNMHISSHWHDWGLHELGQNMILDFNKAYRKRDETRLDEMWEVISALGLWLNVGDHVSGLIGGDDPDMVCGLVELIGLALLTMLDAIEKAGELNSRSRFLDLALVVGYYLEMSRDLPAYGIEGQCVAWRPEVVKYFRVARLNSRKALAVTAKRLVELKDAPNFDFLGDESVEELGKRYERPKKGPDDDAWNWNTALKDYKHKHRPLVKPNKHHYDITKFSRAQRAAECFSGKDPLADVPVADLRADLLDLV